MLTTHTHTPTPVLDVTGERTGRTLCTGCLSLLTWSPPRTLVGGEHGRWTTTADPPPEPTITTHHDHHHQHGALLTVMLLLTLAVLVHALLTALH